MPATSSPDLIPYEYAIIRVVPRVERGERVNVGVVLFCRQRRFLAARVGLEPHHQVALSALAPDLNMEAIRERLNVIVKVCAGGQEAQPVGLLSQAERFRWLVAPSSTVVQPSAVHVGRCADPEGELDQLYETTVAAVDVEDRRASVTIPER